jgi:hypothetical protein
MTNPTPPMAALLNELEKLRDQITCTSCAVSRSAARGHELAEAARHLRAATYRWSRQDTAPQTPPVLYDVSDLLG